MFENPRCLGCFGLYVLQRGSGTYAVRHSEKSSDIFSVCRHKDAANMFALLLRPDEHVSGHSSVLCDKKAGIDDALQIDRYGQYTRYT